MSLDARCAGSLCGRGAVGHVRAGRGRYQHGPTAVPRSTPEPDCKGWPRSDRTPPSSHAHMKRPCGAR